MQWLQNLKMFSFCRDIRYRLWETASILCAEEVSTMIRLKVFSRVFWLKTCLIQAQPRPGLTFFKVFKHYWIYTPNIAPPCTSGFPSQSPSPYLLLWESRPLSWVFPHPSSSSLCRIRYILFHWGQKRQPWRLSCVSATYVPMFVIWLMAQSLSTPKGWVSWLSWSSCGVPNPFRAFIPSPNSSLWISDLHPIFVSEYLHLY